MAPVTLRAPGAPRTPGAPTVAANVESASGREETGQNDATGAVTASPILLSLWALLAFLGVSLPLAARTDALIVNCGFS
jgi:xanthine/uracil/vitamin C permease (AzgA family)